MCSLQESPLFPSEEERKKKKSGSKKTPPKVPFFFLRGGRKEEEETLWVSGRRTAVATDALIGCVGLSLSLARTRTHTSPEN